MWHVSKNKKGGGRRHVGLHMWLQGTSTTKQKAEKNKAATLYLPLQIPHNNTHTYTYINTNITHIYVYVFSFSEYLQYSSVNFVFPNDICYIYMNILVALQL